MPEVGQFKRRKVCLGSVLHGLSPHSAYHTGTWSRGGPFVSFHKDKEKGEIGLEY